MPDRKRLVIIGDAALDYTVVLPKARPDDEKIIVESTHRTLGGTGANSAAVASALGSDVTLITNVGNDPTGQWIKQQLTKKSLTTSHVRTTPGHSAFVTIILGEQRKILVDAGVALEPVTLDPALLKASDLVYVSYSPSAVTKLVQMGFGEKIIAGLEAWMLKDPELLNALQDCRLVITNEAGWSALSPPHHKADLPIDIVETQGSRGARVHHPDGSVTHHKPYSANPVDATGAGDCFASTLVHYLAKGHTLDEAIDRAQLSAALSTEHVGSQAWLPTEAELEELYGQRAKADQNQ